MNKFKEVLMCDTFWKRYDGGIYFAKNSDRGCNEPNLTVFVKGGKREEKEVKCTYISIPQVEKVNSVLLVKPSWMWGAEIGVNEHGVAIGNEAVFTKSKGKKCERLLGMDMLRIALERGNSAAAALDVILDLLKIYGQGGNCGFDKSFYYDNSFLISDKNEGYIVETAGDSFVVKQLEDHGNISNRLSLDEAFYSENSEPIFTFFSGSKNRLRKGCELIKSAGGVSDVFGVLRSHAIDDKNKLYSKGSVKSVCMHQSALGDHTTGSLVVDFGKRMSVWVTGSSTPCLSAFKPVMFGETSAPVFEKEEDSLKYWLDREYLNRAVYGGHIDQNELRTKLNQLEGDFLKKYYDALDKNASDDELKKICQNCSLEEQKLVASYSSAIEGVKSGKLALPKLWAAKMQSLGKNVYESKLELRRCK